MAAISAAITGALKTAGTIAGLSKFWFLPLFVTALVYYHYDIFDPENQPQNVKVLRREYDFVVVGAGSAGSVLGGRLSEVAGWSVLVLEAGTYESEITDVPLLSLYLHKSRYDWGYRSQPQPSACQAMEDKRCVWTRGKVLGGSSVLNTMLYIRGNRRDYDTWASLGNAGWSFEEVLPYFRKSQDQRNPYLARSSRYHATGGPLTVQDAPWHTPLGIALVQAGVEMGYEHRDINGERQTGFALFQFTMRRGYRCSAAKAFLRPARLRPNLHVALHAHVTRVLLDPATRRAYGVEFLRDGVRHTVLARKEVILSAGAINSPQLLMVSGVGPADHLRSLGIPVVQQSPGVGENLMDHIAVGGLVFPVDYPVSVVVDRVMNLNAALRYAVLGEGPLTSSVGLEAVGFVSTKFANRSDDWPDIEFMLTSSSTPSDGGTQARKAHGITQRFYDEMFGAITGKDMYGVFPMILRPKSRGRVRLASADPLRYPLMFHNYLTHPHDVAVLREGAKMALALAETAALRRFGARFHRVPVLGCRHLPPFTDEYWECVVRQYTMTIYHMSGTCKMGPAADPLAVVDDQLRVRGVSGLRVVDASVFPTIPSGNINAPVIMVAEKAADLVKQAWLPRGKRGANQTAADEPVR
ncbi:glucose dehydrogenase [FAD, quinone] [Schistocerca cancellata]|uniref:glucose dehydrogenase [FAD, quinone] n=1 Tax=Schistocerca cancellata TaxID=274614 RepID=UPI002117D651|nr:glucose dehydrogenase [FAD, quinone] [Schistocerca cancellata]